MIYVSTRIGKNGKKFRFYKFRSMRKDAEKELSQLLEKNEVKGGVTFKMENDPRVTRYGRFLRKTSLDELPQLFNILKGDMTFVGPRPCTDRDICDIIDASKVSLPSTLLARGISCKVNHIGGLAQVNSLFVSFIRNGRKTLVASPFFNMRRESNIYA
jgi:lipopolysaccharide/colanic/teichoic acid biosynthesis glycosyltransferase